ncbi:MAG: hypothetical protein KA314_21885 [Chloroflexi bacterium]|nr:hypothetical protein [Chloroflexota bacterium]MBP8058492.1 hypothetical protein [Chloroflexota bacterium]
MILKQRIVGLVLTVMALLLAACSTPGTNSNTIETMTPGLPPAAVLAAQNWVAQQLNVVIEQVELISVEQTEWSDSCLGLGQANESCAQVITPGWQAVFLVNGQEFEIRTDETASVIRSAQIVPEQ